MAVLLLVATMVVGATVVIATIARLFDLRYTGGAYGRAAAVPDFGSKLAQPCYLLRTRLRTNKLNAASNRANSRVL